MQSNWLKGTDLSQIKQCIFVRQESLFVALVTLTHSYLKKKMGRTPVMRTVVPHEGNRF